MKKKRNKMGLKGILLTAGLTLASIFPGNADEPSERYYPFDFYHQPNNHVKMGRNFLDWYGSGDVNNDGVVNYEDYEAIDTVTPGDRADIDGDGTPSTENDKKILKQYLDGEIEHLPGYWNELNTTEKIEWYQNMEAIYLRDFPGMPSEFQGTWDCTEYSRNRLIDFAGIPNFKEHPLHYLHEKTTKNARFNIPMIEVRIGGTPTPHDINALYVGDGTEGDVTENLIDGYLYIENGGQIRDPRNYWAMSDSSYQSFKKEGYYNWIRAPPWGEGDFFTTWSLLNWEMDENLEVDKVSFAPTGHNILSFDPLKYDTITFKAVPENKLINYQSDLDISGSLEEEVDTAHSKLKPLWTINPQTNDTIIQYVFTKTNYENSEKINLGQEHEGEFYNYKFVRKAIAETPWIKDSVNWEIEVKDIEAPKINDFPEDEQMEYQTSLDLENYVVPENLEVIDNSGLEAILDKSTESTQKMDGTANQVNFNFYTDITATDKFGNDTTYTHKAEVRDTEVPKINDFPDDEQFNYSTDKPWENYIIPENLEVTDNSELGVNLEKTIESTQVMDGTANQVNFDFYTDITAIDKTGNDTTYTHKAEVRDTENPSGQLEDYYVQRESGQSPEEAVKSLVENVYDNSELPVDTIVEQTSEKFYDVFLKDIVGNENYLGNVEVDEPVGTGDNPSELENKCDIIPYPNPNPEAIKYLQPDFGETEISVYDMSGRLMRKQQYNSQPGENNVNYDFNLAQGVYTVTMDSESCKDAEKIIIDGRK